MKLYNNYTLLKEHVKSLGQYVPKFRCSSRLMAKQLALKHLNEIKKATDEMIKALETQEYENE